MKTRLVLLTIVAVMVVAIVAVACSFGEKPKANAVLSVTKRIDFPLLDKCYIYYNGIWFEKYPGCIRPHFVAK